MAQLVYDLTVRFCNRYVPRTSRTRDQMVQAARSGVQNVAEGSLASGTSRRTELKLANVARAGLEELRLDYEDFLRQHGLVQWPPEHPALVRFKAKHCSTLDQVQAWAKEERGRTRTGTDKCRQTDDRARSVSIRVGLQAYRIVVSAKMLLFRACVPRPPGSPCQGQRTKYKGRSNGEGESGNGEVRSFVISTSPLLLSFVLATSSFVGGVLTFGLCLLPFDLRVRRALGRSVSSAELAANGALSLLNLCCYRLDRRLAAQAAALEKEGGFTERMYRIRQERRAKP